MSGLLQDVRYSLRQLRKSPGFAAVAIISLALGIGANTTIFTLIHTLILKSLPVRDPQQLVAFGKEDGGGVVDGIGPGRLEIYPYDFYKQVEQNHGPFQGIAATGSFPVSVSIRNGNTRAEQGTSYLVSGNFFNVIGADPMLGRTLAPSDADAPGSQPVAVLSYRYWHDSLSGDQSVVGRPIDVNGTPFTVIGVMPPKFVGAELNEEAPDMWLPLTMQAQAMLRPSLLNPHGPFWLHFMGRRAAGTNMPELQAWMTSQLQQFMVDREGSQPTPQRMQDIRKIYVELLPGAQGVSHIRNQFEQPLLILMFVVILVLAIACANLANFLLSRSVSREGELSTRMALGASRSRLARQIFTEAMLLSCIGGVCGLALAFWGTKNLVAFVTAGSQHAAIEASPNLPVLFFTLGISLLTGMFFGVVPALRASRVGTGPMLNATARTATGAGRGSNRLLAKVLLTAQVGLSIVLLVGAGLFVRTMQNIEHQDFGFDRHSLLLVELDFKLAGYKSEQLDGMYERILSRVEGLPGIKSAALSGGPPIQMGNWISPITVTGHLPARDEDRSTLISSVSPEYFQASGIPLMQGRSFGTQDAASSAKAVVVSQAMANYFFPKGDAIGRRFSIADPSVTGPWQIVGIVRDAKYNDVRGTAQRMIYLPLAQLTADSHFARSLEIQTSGDPASVEQEVRAALADADPNLPILHVRTISEQLGLFMENEKLISELSTFFSMLALALACIGLYGVAAYGVARRTNEIGVRIALGARQRSILWMILRESLMLLAFGIVIGVPVALAAARLVQRQLFGLSPSDPNTIMFAILAIGMVVVLAAIGPARRAANVDPMVALRYE